MAPVKTKSGRPVTDEAIENLARKFESGYEPENFKPRHTGRPPLGADYPSPRIQVRLPRQLYDSVSKQAHEEGTTVSAFIRRLLEKHAS